MSFEPADTQGNVVRGYRHLHNVRYVFCEIRELGSFRALLGALLSADGLHSWGVRSDEHWKDKRRVHTALNVAFTYAGLQRLGWGAEFGAFEDFRQGMYARAARELCDSDPESWPPALRDAAHVLFTIYFDDDPASAEEVSTLRTELRDSGGLHEVAFQAAAVKKMAGEFGKREHFGFRDGFSQPALERGPRHAAPRRVEGEGVLDPPSSPLAGSRWRALRLGEVLLGHLDEDGLIPGEGEPVLRNGSFMVWRKLEQHVERFERYFERIASGKERQEWLKAKVIGRWPDGTSLLESPHARPAKARRKPRNRFDYGEDPYGVACPLGAHVRRANPRIGLKWWTLRTRRHRIIRRGMPYEERDEQGRLHRGLIFVCFNASISRQFELIQGRWLMDGDAFGLGSERDFMLAAHAGGEKMIVQGDSRRPAILLPDAGERFVSVLGGYYLFVPGIAALKLIAREPSTRGRAKLPAAAR